MTFTKPLSRKPMEFRHCPGPPVELWGAADNEISGEVEVPEFLYALVRLMKPAVCYELGSGMGLTTRAIGEALRANGRGMLVSVDHAADMVREARHQCAGLPVEILQLRTEDLALSREDIDFLFIDSGEDVERFADFARCSEAVSKQHGIVAIHDTGLYSALGESILKVPGWRALFFPTPLGLTLMQKVA